MNDLTGALCRGRHELFDSVHRADHNAAAKLCRVCPEAIPCLLLLREMQSYSNPSHGGPVGTWAGVLVGTLRQESAQVRRRFRTNERVGSGAVSGPASAQTDRGQEPTTKESIHG